jgi:hypothetical protein
MKVEMLVGICGLSLGTFVISSSPVSALPSISQPGSGFMMAPPANPPLSQSANCIASRNFTNNYRTPGAAITGGVFNDYGIPGFFPYGTGTPGSGTGGWVSGMAAFGEPCQ